MVWYQYVYEATTGNDVEVDSDCEFIGDEPERTIEDWEIAYSEELNMMWDTMRTLMYDAHIEHQGNFIDFVDFCYTEHDTDSIRTTWEYQEQTIWYEERLVHIWKNLRRNINNNGLHEEMMRGAKFSDFTWFLKNIMCIY
jgi:hypothetical protein